PAPRTIEAQPAIGSTEIHIDGNFDEPIWATAAHVNDFVQREPVEGGPASYVTDVQVAFDQTALYVAVRASQPAAEVRGLLTRRDADSPSDWVRVMIDSYH